AIECITLPPAMVNVGDQAFRSCKALKELRVMCEAAPMCSGDIADVDVYARTLLRVPQGKVGEYGFAPVWERFGNVEEIG
ncbi:MAG: hypothetical protein II198_05620, partial [Bacteroidaceae bacterium]|nr:hypothetical protein [Bacteroidaceae bacterium]